MERHSTLFVVEPDLLGSAGKMEPHFADHLLDRVGTGDNLDANGARRPAEIHAASATLVPSAVSMAHSLIARPLLGFSLRIAAISDWNPPCQLQVGLITI
jgi:hypothetical protein